MLGKKKQKSRLFLKAWRKHRGLTQSRLAERAEVTQGLISQLENGRTDYSGAVLEKLAEALACEPQDLIMRDPSRPNAIWSIMDNLKKATPAEQEQVDRITEALIRKTGT